MSALARIEINLATQALTLFKGGQPLRVFSISSALNGAGEQNGSGCTPRGRHRIRAKIGDGFAPGSVFVARRPTAEQYSPELASRYPQRDWILSRILWLSGCEPGRNRLGQVDSMRALSISMAPPTASRWVYRARTAVSGCVTMR